MPHKLDMWDDPMLRDLEAELAEPFLTENISWRVGSTNRDKTKGMALAYMDARDVMERLDGVMGIGNWQDRYINAGNGKTCCEIGLFLDGHWVWKSDGAGDTGMEGDKGAFSDAFKRAAVRWGIGRYLYDLKAPWVEIEAFGKSHRIKEAEVDKLNKVHDAHAAKVGMSSPSERAAIRTLINTIRKSCTTQAQVQQWIDENKSNLSILRSAQKGEVWAAIQHIGTGKEAA